MQARQCLTLLPPQVAVSPDHPCLLRAADVDRLMGVCGLQDLFLPQALRLSPVQQLQAWQPRSSALWHLLASQASPQPVV